MIFSHFSGKAIRSVTTPPADVPLLDLASEELSFAPSPEIIESAERILRMPETFVHARGALKEKLRPKGGGILFTNGVKSALTLALQTYLNPNDEVALFAPCPSYYTGIIHLAGSSAKVFTLDEEENFSPDPASLRMQISPRTRMILLGNPHSPTGMIWDKATLTGLFTLAKEKNLMLLADESSASFIYEGGFTSLEEISPRFENLIIVRDLTSPLALPGWHIASLSADADFTARAEAVWELSQGGLNSTSLHILSEVWESLGEQRRLIIEDLHLRRDFLLKALGGQHGFRILTPAAGLSCFPYMRYYLGNEIGGEVPTTSAQFSEILARTAGVWVEPGSSFGLDGFFKCSFTKDPDTLAEAVRRISGVLERGKPRR